MKYILFILALIVGISSHAQQRYIIEKQIPDTISVKVQDELIYMRKQLSQSHYYFNTGLAAVVMGTATGLFYINAEPTPTILYTSYALFGLGTVCFIVSHRFIGKAGIGVGGKGVVVRYTF